MNLLVVEDNPVTASALAELLRRAGFAVESAGSGLVALGKVAAHAPDAIVLDQHMPGMDGVAFLRELRRSESPWGRVPVVMVTAAPDDLLDALPGELAGMGPVVVLRKPFEIDTLLAALKGFGVVP